MTRTDPAKRNHRVAHAMLNQQGRGDGFDPPEVDDLEGLGTSEAFLSEETGLDLSITSELDADNVLADEEFDRVLQAPD